MEREKLTQFITQRRHRFVENRNASFPATTYHLLHTLVTCGQIVDDCWIMFDKLLGNLQTCFAGVVDYLWTLVGRLLDDFRMTCSTFNLKGLKEKLNPTSPLGYRWFRNSFNQNTSSPYPLPGPPIRPPWITRGRTPLSRFHFVLRPCSEQHRDTKSNRPCSEQHLHKKEPTKLGTTLV